MERVPVSQEVEYNVTRWSPVGAPAAAVARTIPAEREVTVNVARSVPTERTYKQTVLERRERQEIVTVDVVSYVPTEKTEMVRSSGLCPGHAK
jgi:hypothetical protein